MKFVTFEHGGAPAVGVLSNGMIYGLNAIVFPDMLTVITRLDAAKTEGEKAIAAGSGHPIVQTKLYAPIQRPPRIFCIGLNYAKHAAESKMQVQKVPTVFMKLSSSVVGPGDEVILPHNSAQPDYEVELAVVIGKPGYRIKADNWSEYVAGYTIVNDVSARDIQLASSQWTLGKSFPSFTPLGPALVTADEIPDPHALDLSLSINGEVLQNSNTSDLIFRIPQIIEYISAYTPLEAGDVISTGTPEGVGMGRTPQRWLKPGEEMVVKVQGLGELINKTVAEKAN